MRTINFNDIGEELKNIIFEEDPISEDIGILNSDGKLIAVVIPGDLYKFLQEKVEEAENDIDEEVVRDFNKNRE